MAEKEQTVKILIADDSMIFRDGLKQVLAEEPAFHVVGEASDGADTLLMVRLLKPDILLLDLYMPQMPGMAVLHALSETDSTVKIILLSNEADDGAISAAFKLGARGIVSKESTPDMLFQGIQAVMAGQYWIHSQKATCLDKMHKLHSSLIGPARSKKFKLTPREFEVMTAVVSGWSNKKIASGLTISEQTVKHHITSIFDKLGVYNRLELILFVHHHNLIPGSSNTPLDIRCE